MRRFWMLLTLPALGCDMLTEALDDGSKTGDTGTDGSGDDDDDNGNGDDDDDGGGSGGSLSCTRGSLFAGDPLYPDPQDRPTDGQGLLDTPPLLSRNLLFTGDLMVTHMGQELWKVDLSEGSPTLDRFAGREALTQSLITGACEQARFANVMGLGLGPDGTLYVSDQTANAVLRITDPFGPDCTLHHMAGSSADYESLSPASVPNQGEQDGPGLQASFRGVERITVSDEGEVFVWDLGNGAIRKIAADEDRTVSTLLTGVDGNVQAMTWLDGKLYLWGNGGDLYLTEVDPVTGERRDILSGRGDIFGWDSSSSLFTGGMVTDGEDLIVYFNGTLYRVTLQGDITRLAGTDIYFEFESGYDPYAPHPADELQLVSSGQVGTAGANQWLGIDAQDDVYMSTKYTSPYIMKMECER
jgi:hypothetical protein